MPQNILRLAFTIEFLLALVNSGQAKIRTSQVWVTLQRGVKILFGFRVVLKIGIRDTQAIVIECNIGLDGDILQKLIAGLLKICARKIGETQIEMQIRKVRVELRCLLKFGDCLVPFLTI